MAKFGPNGTVLPGDQTVSTPGATYAVPTTAKFKRIALASFLCGMAACILVTLIGLTLLFLGFLGEWFCGLFSFGSGAASCVG